MHVDISGTTAIVTGGNHGIGAAIALALARDGVNVVITFLRLDPVAIDAASYPGAYGEARAADARSTLDAIKSEGGSCIAVELDIRDSANIPLLFNAAVEEFGAVDILVNNASAWLADTFDWQTPDRFGRRLTTVDSTSFDYVHGVDARGAALLIAEYCSRLSRSGRAWGRIISLTSGGRGGFPGEVSYGAAKAALESLTLSAALELHTYGVTANVIHPPAVDTGWLTEATRASIRGRVLSPEAVAQSVMLLMSRQADYISGQVISLS